LHIIITKNQNLLNLSTLLEMRVTTNMEYNDQKISFHETHNPSKEHSSTGDYEGESLKAN